MTPATATATWEAATLSEHQGVRYLHLGTPWVQGAMRLRTPQRIELEYVRRMMAWMLWRDQAVLTDPRALGHAVHFGLGAAALTRFTHQTLGMETTAVELNPSVIIACRMYFALPPDGAGLQVLNDDAARWAADPAHRGTVQVLHVDLYDHEAAAPVLDDEAFYRDCHALLADGGLMTVNLFGRDASFERSAARIAAAFGLAQVWFLKPTRERNTIVVAARGVPVPDRKTLLARAAAIEAQHRLPARKWLRLVRPLRLQSPGLIGCALSASPAAASP